MGGPSFSSSHGKNGDVMDYIHMDFSFVLLSSIYISGDLNREQVVWPPIGRRGIALAAKKGRRRLFASADRDNR
jgi:hypothetical protein